MDSPHAVEYGVAAYEEERGLVAALLVILALLAAMGFAVTQWLAWRFGYAPALGPPLLAPGPQWRAALVPAGGALLALAVVLAFVSRRTRRLTGVPILLAGMAYAASFGPIYAPWKGFLWLRTAEETTGYAWMVEEVALSAAAGGLGALLCLLPLLITLRKDDSGAYGTAGWYDGRALMEATRLKQTLRMLTRRPPKKAGLIVGRKDDRLLRYDRDGHLLTVAPTRSGKGVGAVMPNLLDYAGSTLVTDPKGENYAVTARYREEELGHQILALDPFREVAGAGHYATYNPMDLIVEGSDDAIDDARMLARMLVIPSGGSDAKFWEDEARQFLAGLILYVAGTERRGSGLRSLPYVRKLLMLPSEEQPVAAREEERAFIRTYGHREITNEHIDGVGRDGRPRTFPALLKDMSARTQLFNEAVARAAHQLVQKADKEYSGVLSHAQSATNFLDSERMKEALATSSFEMSGLKRSKKTVYLILPSHRLDTYNRWLRLVIACGLTAMSRTRGKPRRRVLFLLDEFTNLGMMRPVVKAISLMAGYGASLWIFLQDLSQLKHIYPRNWETFIANTDVLQAFANKDHLTADHVARLIGKATIFVERTNVSKGHSGDRSSRNRSEGTSETGRHLLNADEIRRLDEDKQILLVGNHNPILSDKIRYYAEPPFKGRADERRNHMERAVDERATEKMEKEQDKTPHPVPPENVYGPAVEEEAPSDAGLEAWTSPLVREAD